MGALIFREAVVNDFTECALVAIESRYNQIGQHIVARDGVGA
jgi:hypothetical protein